MKQISYQIMINSIEKQQISVTIFYLCQILAFAFQKKSEKF